MRLSIVTPQGEKVKAEVASVTAPGAAGELGILPGHRPLITSLKVGDLRYLQDNRTHHLAINGGFLEIHEDRIVVVTETAERPGEIDTERAAMSKKMAEQELGRIERKESPELYLQALGKLARAENRLTVAKAK